MPDLDYTDLIPENTTPEGIEDGIFGRIQTQFPEWQPHPAELDVWIVQGLSQAISELYEVTSEVAAEIFAYFGETIMNLPRNEAVTATASSTWTLTDTAAHLIGVGTLVGISNGMDTIPFQVAEDVLVAAGPGTATVPLKAVDAGISGNDLSGDVTLIDSLAFVDTITLDDPTAGGVDEETMDAYLPRLVELLQLMSPRPILPKHFEVLARQYGAFRAVAIEGLNPGDGSTDNPLEMAIAVMDSAGEDLDTGDADTFGTKAYIEAKLLAQLMANSVIHLINAQRTAIDVTCVLESLPEYDHAQVIAGVEAALTTYFTPINWGKREGFGQVPTTWVNTPTVRFLEIAEVINRVPGVDYIDSLTFRKTGGSHDTVDVTLTGYVPLTEPGTLTIT